MSQLYRQYSRPLAILILLALPFLFREANSLPTNNDIEAWLPDQSDFRAEYDNFKSLFGGEEAILIGIPNQVAEPQLIKAIASRIESLDGIRSCWTPQRFTDEMAKLGVTPETARERLRGLVVSRDGSITGLVAILSEDGLLNREGTVHDVQHILTYSQLSDEDVLFSGAPVIVAELNRLGSQKNTKQFFLCSLMICFGLLMYSIRHWRLSSAILLITVFAIQTTLCIVKWWSGEMNFILSALPVMVMVFTMASSIHLLHYFNSSRDETDPLAAALSKAWRPCLLATFTTVIGLLSLTVSEIAPVQQFGIAAATGAVISCICGLGLTPIALSLWPISFPDHHDSSQKLPTRLSLRIIRHRRAITWGTCIFLLVSLPGIVSLTSKVDPLDFLPRKSDVVQDYLDIEEKLTNVDSFEAVVDFETQDLPFTEKLRRVKQIEMMISAHPNIQHTLSLASFFPERLPDNGLDIIQLLSTAKSNQHGQEYISAGERYWRISARVHGESTNHRQRIFEELQHTLKAQPVTLTGIAPLIKQAQDDIFIGFWESFATALGIIAIVMMIALRSIKTALLAMIPNLTPLCLVFGFLGWAGIPVDIGMMMTASIALGIAVDGTFHFLLAYRDHSKQESRTQNSSLYALFKTGRPIFEAAMIASLGMLALTQSQFIPTIRFGLLMSILLIVAVFADLVLLPALLAKSPSRQVREQAGLRKSRTQEPSRIAA
ncbi:efflux RND transporter permease subunit [Thalassoglobus polymorphus]|uniref:MMPL family protein n=1 Tax=Thalassoglobus polymorphus TaxID=2527994 RepID=A0A517QIV7_9PLAN|nr:MMPL family transporter [Thalassoglobus polymorphus]QDT31554.1 MMPL family protein [Thalassoglobus polymorphus]